MSAFLLNTIETAPQASRASLDSLQTAFGFLPNIARAMSTSPVLIDSLVGLFQKVHGGSFSEAQIQILLLTNAVTNAAEWPVAFHSYLALQSGVPAADVAAIRRGQLPAGAADAALSRLAKTLIEKRGGVDEAEIEACLEAGFSRGELLEVIAVVAASAITNYTAKVTRPPLEAPFDAHAWTAR